MALCALMQWDLFCRIGNIIGQYPMMCESFKCEGGSSFIHTRELVQSVDLVGSKTTNVSCLRNLKFNNPMVRSALTKFLNYLLTSRNFGPSNQIFSFSVHDYNSFLMKKINSTSHSLRSLGARTHAQVHGDTDTMKRGGWKSLSSYNRYVQSI